VPRALWVCLGFLKHRLQLARQAASKRQPGPVVLPVDAEDVTVAKPEGLAEGQSGGKSGGNSTDVPFMFRITRSQLFDIVVPGRVSTVAVQRFCKPKVGGSNPSPGTIPRAALRGLLPHRFGLG
jgi:hypothetical protein